MRAHTAVYLHAQCHLPHRSLVHDQHCAWAPRRSLQSTCCGCAWGLLQARGCRRRGQPGHNPGVEPDRGAAQLADEGSAHGLWCALHMPPFSHATCRDPYVTGVLFAPAHAPLRSRACMRACPAQPFWLPAPAAWLLWLAFACAHDVITSRDQSRGACASDAFMRACSAAAQRRRRQRCRQTCS